MNWKYPVQSKGCIKKQASKMRFKFMLLLLAFPSFAWSHQITSNTTIKAYIFKKIPDNLNISSTNEVPSKLTLPFPKEIVNKTFTAFTICLRFSLSFGKESVIFDNVGGISLSLRKPKLGYGMIELRCLGASPKYCLFFLSEEAVSVYR